MAHLDEDSLPDELRDVADLLRRERTLPSPLEFDRIKLQAIRRAKVPGAGSDGPVGVRLLRTRLAGLALAIAALIVGGGAIVGSAGGLPSGGLLAGHNAAHDQYCEPGSHDNDDDDDERGDDKKSKGHDSKSKSSKPKGKPQPQPKPQPKPKPKPKPTDCDDD